MIVFARFEALHHCNLSNCAFGIDTDGLEWSRITLRGKGCGYIVPYAKESFIICQTFSALTFSHKASTSSF